MTDSAAPQSSSHQQRLAGDIVFAAVFLAVAVLLSTQIGTQTAWIKGVKLVAQPRFWPAIGLAGMCFFALCYYLGSMSSRHSYRQHFAEVKLWLRSFEYAFWFMAYVWVVPRVGYLPSTLIFVAMLMLRAGYRSFRTIMFAGIVGIAIVVIFKSFLAVKIPGGQLYEYLPDSLRNFMTLYL